MLNFKMGARMESNSDVRNADKGFYSIAKSKQTTIECILLANSIAFILGDTIKVNLTLPKSQIDTSTGTKPVGFEAKTIRNCGQLAVLAQSLNNDSVPPLTL